MWSSPSHRPSGNRCSNMILFWLACGSTEKLPFGLAMRLQQSLAVTAETWNSQCFYCIFQMHSVQPYKTKRIIETAILFDPGFLRLWNNQKKKEGLWFKTTLMSKSQRASQNVWLCKHVYLYFPFSWSLPADITLFLLRQDEQILFCCHRGKIKEVDIHFTTRPPAWYQLGQMEAGNM